MSELAATLSRRSLPDQVADALVQHIIDNGLGEGDSLPSTAELALSFEVSRTVIREALADLAGRGVLTRSQGRESVIATPGPSELSSLLQFRLRRSAVATEDIFECRSGLELTTARGAAMRATDEHIAQLWEQLAALDAAKGGKSFHEADIALHRGIAVASGNALVVLMLDSLVDLLHDVRVKASRSRKARGESFEQVVEQHRRIVTAIAARDPEAATAAMADHLFSTRAEYERSTGG